MSSLGSGELYAAIARLRQRFDQHRKRKLDDYALLSYPSAAAADSDDDDDQDSFPLLKMHKLGSSSSSPAVSDDHPSQLRPQHSSFSFPSSSSSTLHFFVREINELGSRRTIELCPKGKDIVVNSKNREEYVNLLIQHHFVTSISEQVTHFAQGGSDSVINVKEWKAHTEYNGYKAKDRQICWFWKESTVDVSKLNSGNVTLKL
ncbi:hypothetical protein COCNU_01G007030 [Cocos nucifera]|uniref:HECT-type E3 ubiquitin transferase n=1 Tax=Cocos nucifera TaxID=13894 RepID=A0A8K0MUL7_COCNU|nr:hypothetical protein COCNU_01G007030 [Cocos nucifera]